MAAYATPASLQNAISLLTCPLLASHSPAVVAILCRHLQVNLRPRSLKSFNIHLHLSASGLPPAALISACFASGVSWPQWIGALGGKTMDLYISSTSVVLKNAGSAPLTLWNAPTTEDDDEDDEVPISKSQITVIPPTPSVTSTSFEAIKVPKLLTVNTVIAPRPSSPASSISSASDRIFTDDEASDISSASSVSSRSASPEPKKTWTSPRVLKTKSEWSPVGKQNSGFTRRSKPVVDCSKAEVVEYKYEGGKTNVLTGGVMLGGASTSPATPAQKKPTTRARAASRAVSWRRA